MTFQLIIKLSKVLKFQEYFADIEYNRWVSFTPKVNAYEG